ncbi:MAG: phosphate acyltransferase PlsX [Elusimicrobiota bacterium]
MRIAVDAMGGDHAPDSNIEGAIEALSPEGIGPVARKQETEIVLVGKKELIKKKIAEKGYSALPIEIYDASQVIEMDESPVEACRKKPDSSIMVGISLAKNKEIDAFVSAGNSGAVMGSAVMSLERLKGVRRPAIAAIFPTLKEPCVVVDVGANAECKPKNLHQFALMGEAYVKYVFKKRIPRVALLSMGHEESKGDTATQAAYKTLMKNNLNFIGNIEGGDIIKGVADVIVCNGFMGNVVLKFGEELASSILGLLRVEIDKSLVRKIGAKIMEGAFRDVKKKINYDEVGGAPLLGVNGVCIICHGISNAKAIKNAINVAVEFVEQDVNRHIEESLL